MDFSLLKRFQEELWDYGIAGNDIGIYVDGKCVYRHMTGWSNIAQKTPINEKTIYQMYSMTKPITCTAALMLYEQGAYLMDQPLSDFFPEFARMRVKERMPNSENATVWARNPIQIQDLFTMSAGFNYDLNLPAIRALREQNPSFTTCEAVRALANEPLEFEPGTHWLYSLCHDVLGALIEKWSGMRFGEYLQKHIFKPLDIKNAAFRQSDNKLQRLAVTYQWREGERAEAAYAPGNMFVLSPEYESGGAGLSMTVDDYARFANALCLGGVSPDTGARLLSAGMVRTMRENQLDDVRLHDFHQNVTREGYGYGLGVRTLMSSGLAASAGLPGEFGWGGMAGTYVMIDPNAHMTLVYAQQSVPGQNGYTHRRIRNLAYRALED